MARLPVVGSDSGTWGTIENDYLSVEHNAGGFHTLTPSSTYIRSDGTVAQIGPTFYNAESYGFMRGTDNATQLATVLTAMTSAPGTLYIPGGAWPYSTAAGLVIPKTACGLIGDGWSTVLMPTHNVAAHAISNHVSTNGTTDPNAVLLRFSDFQLDCSNMPTGAFNGIMLDSSPSNNFNPADYRPRYFGTTSALSGTGSVQTYTIPSSISFNYVQVGDVVKINGAAPAGYNGTFTVTAVSGGISLTTFSVAGATTGAQTTPGFVQLTGKDAAGLDADPKHYLSSLLIKNAPQDCFAMHSEGGIMLFRCHAFQSIRYGFNSTVDSEYVGCVSSSAGSAGYSLASPGVELAACKSFYSGWQSSTNGHGFYIQNIGASGSLVLNGCVAQDNRKHGFEVVDCENVNITGCVADSNSGTYNNYIAGGYGIDLFSVHHCNFDLLCMDRNDGGFGARQRNAIQVRSGCYDNKIKITHAGTGGTSFLQGGGPGANFGTPIVAGQWDTASTPNTVEINGSNGQQQQPYTVGTGVTTALSGTGTVMSYTVSSTTGLIAGDKVTVAGATPAGFNGTDMTVTGITSATVFTVAGSAVGPQTVAATSVTITTPVIDPTEGGSIVVGTLTGPITIFTVASGDQWPGQKVRFTFTQDATATQHIVWNAVWHLAGGTALPAVSGKSNVIEFEYDLSAAIYRETFRATGI